MYLILILGFLLLGPPTVGADSRSKPAARGPECVILPHGLGRTSHSLNKMARALQAEGFRTVNLDYPSRKKTIQELAPQAVERGLSRCAQNRARTVHFVTHSMGGVLVRYYLSRHRPENLGRVVMLNPPNRGSEAADHLRDSALYIWFNGPIVGLTDSRLLLPKALPRLSSITLRRERAPRASGSRQSPGPHGSTRHSPGPPP
jgi:pimeloyl-ACP methyl ester carboxylesterase